MYKCYQPIFRPHFYRSVTQSYSIFSSCFLLHDRYTRRWPVSWLDIYTTSEFSAVVDIGYDCKIYWLHNAVSNQWWSSILTHTCTTRHTWIKYPEHCTAGHLAYIDEYKGNYNYMSRARIPVRLVVYSRHIRYSMILSEDGIL